MHFAHEDKVRTERTNFVREQGIHVAYEAFDRKGRQIGIWYNTGEATFVPIQSSVVRTSYWTMPAGHYYTACAHTTRDGMRFGALQPDNYFVTKDERDAYIERRIADGRKAAAKKK